MCILMCSPSRPDWLKVVNELVNHKSDDWLIALHSVLAVILCHPIFGSNWQKIRVSTLGNLTGDKSIVFFK